MFLRATKRFKDGKVHCCWSMVENVRVGRRVFRHQALYLGELNDSQREEWQRAVKAFDENGKARQLKLFPEDRAPETDDRREDHHPAAIRRTEAGPGHPAGSARADVASTTSAEDFKRSGRSDENDRVVKTVV